MVVVFWCCDATNEIEDDIDREAQKAKNK